MYRVQRPDQFGTFNGLAVARSLGDELMKVYGVAPTPTVTSLDMTPRDRCLVLGSDGLYEFLTNEDVVRLAQQHRKAMEAILSATRTAEPSLAV